MPRIATYANVASTLALVLAVSGGAYAAATITGKDIKDDSITGKDVLTNSLSGRDIGDGTIRSSELGKGALPGASAAITTSGAIPAGTSAAYVFDTEIYDTARMYTSGAYIQAPRSGVYQLSAGLAFAQAGQYGRQVRILVNDEIRATGIASVNGSDVMVLATQTLRLTAGDRVSLGTYNGGADANLTNFSGESPDAWLTVQMVSP